MNKENIGWVKLHRKSIGSTIFQNEKNWYVWTWCLMKANHDDNKFQFNGKDIMIKRGQFITGRDKALREMPAMTPQKYRTAINYLKSTNRITCEVTNKFTIITVCKYEDYQNKNEQANQQTNQQDNQPITSQQPTDNQPITINKKDLEYINNEEKGEEGKFAPNFLDFIVLKFQEVYSRVNNVPYVILPEQKEKQFSAAAKVLKLYKEATGKTNEDEFKDEISGYFEAVINHPDSFHRGNMDFPYLAENFNKINNGRINGKKGGGISDGQFRKFIEGLLNSERQSNEAAHIPSQNSVKYPPSLNEVISYFEENQYKKEVALIAYNDFCRWNWKSNTGRSFVSEWKMRAAQLYFRPENLYCDPNNPEKLMMP